MSILPLNKHVIYALVDPRDGMVRYVGVTKNPARRLTDHLRGGRGQSGKKDWIEELQAIKLMPVFVFLDSVLDVISKQEEREWITHFQRLGLLYNGKTTENNKNKK